jgi:hypothetical protein
MTPQPNEAVSGTVLRDILAGCEGLPEGPWEQRHDDEVWDALGKWFAVSTDEGAAHIARLDPQTIASIVSELIARREADVWQDIRTAPKDCRILVWSPLFKGKAVAAKWNADEYSKKPRPFWDTDTSRYDGLAALREFPPTHWCHLPPPPLSTNEPKP